MKTIVKNGRLVLMVVLLLLFGTGYSQATIDGITGPSFNLVARTGHISTPDGNSILMWGYANGDGLMQYPGPSLIVNQGETITINLKNELPDMNVSMVFPGQTDVVASGGLEGLLTMEAPPDGVTTVTYTFTASQPGTYLYHSGTRPELQIEMGLVGAIIVRPAGYTENNKITYGHPGTRYDYEYLFLLTELDPKIHELVEFGKMAQIDNTTYFPVYWMINGRSAPDTMLPDFTPWLPHQPYGCYPRMNPGGKLLMRVIGAGRDLHPFHHHGNNADIIARDGRLLASAPGAGPDLAQSVFTIQTVPGGTVDAIFQWTGEKLGWDIYGTGPDYQHDCNPGPDGFDDLTYEYCPDHGKPFPIVMPEKQELAFGGFWSGSPFMGTEASLPPGEGGLNMHGGFFFMWHSHTEKEMVNFDIFPGGMMTMMVVEPPYVDIP